jgi:hypothetical protein
MSTSASDSGLRVLMARAISALASCSQVDALSKPVLVSILDFSRSWACIMNRRASSTVGTAKMASTGLTATTTVIRTARSNSAKSPCSASRLNSTSASLMFGSDSFMAPSMNRWLMRPPTISHAATATVHVRACTPVPIEPPAKDAGKTRKSSATAP